MHAQVASFPMMGSRLPNGYANGKPRNDLNFNHNDVVEEEDDDGEEDGPIWPPCAFADAS